MAGKLLLQRTINMGRSYIFYRTCDNCGRDFLCCGRPRKTECLCEFCEFEDNQKESKHMKDGFALLSQDHDKIYPQSVVIPAYNTTEDYNKIKLIEREVEEYKWLKTIENNI